MLFVSDTVQFVSSGREQVKVAVTLYISVLEVVASNLGQYSASSLTFLVFLHSPCRLLLRSNHEVGEVIANFCG
jgi:hypothetical protein